MVFLDPSPCVTISNFTTLICISTPELITTQRASNVTLMQGSRHASIPWEVMCRIKYYSSQFEHKSIFLIQHIICRYSVLELLHLMNQWAYRDIKVLKQNLRPLKNQQSKHIEKFLINQPRRQIQKVTRTGQANQVDLFSLNRQMPSQEIWTRPSCTLLPKPFVSDIVGSKLSRAFQGNKSVG